MKTRRPRGSGSIFGPDAKGEYRVRVSLGAVDGKRKRVEAKVKSQSAARAKLAELQARYGLSRGMAAPPRLDAYLDTWLESRADSIEAKTIRNYRFGIAQIAPRLGHIRMDRLTSQQISAAFAGLRAEGKGKRTIQVAHDTLRAALNAAVKRDRILAMSPMPSALRPRIEREIDFLIRDEAKAFLAATEGDRYRALFVLAVSCGLRLGEIRGLFWRDVDLEAGTLTVSRAAKESGAAGRTKSRSSKRRVDLPASTVAALRAHYEKRKGAARTSPLVFCTERGTALHPSSFERRHFFPALERAGLRRIRFHDLRHTCASLRLLAGEHPSVVQALLGHASIVTTLNTYGHLAPTAGRESAARYEEMMNG